MAEKKAWVRIGARADGSLKRALKGVTDATRKASGEVTQSSKKRVDEARRAERELQTAARRTGQEQARIEREKVRAAKKAADEQVRIARRTAQAKIREEKRAAEAQLRDARRVTRERRQMMVGGALIGGYHAAKGLVSQAQGVAGVGTTESRLERAMIFKRGLIRKGIEAGLTEEQLPDVEQKVLAAAGTTGADPVEIMEGLVKAQTEFSKFKEFIPLLEDIGKVSIASESKFSDLVGMLGTASQIFNLSGEEMKEALYFMSASATAGSLSVGDFSDKLAKFAGQYKGMTEAQGFKGFREMVGTFQATQKSLLADPSEVGTFTRALIKGLIQPDIQRDLKRKEISVTDETGKLLPMPELIKTLYEARQSGQLNRREQQKIFGKDVRSFAGYISLMQTLEADPEYFKKVVGATPEAGRELTRKQYGALMGGEMGRLQRMGVNAQIKAIKSMEDVAKAERILAERVTDLQTEFPILTKALGSLESVVTGLIGGLMMGRMMGAGAAAVGAGGVTTAAGAIGKVGVLKALGIAAASFVITNAVLELMGYSWKDRKDAGARIWEQVHGGGVERQGRGLDPEREQKEKIREKMEAKFQKEAAEIESIGADVINKYSSPKTVELGDNTIRKVGQSTAEAMARNPRGGGGEPPENPRGTETSRRRHPAGR